MRELQTDVSLRVSDTDSTDAFEVCGRGELHLSILIENIDVRATNSPSPSRALFTAKSTA